jgi:hypothetical protein
MTVNEFVQRTYLLAAGKATMPAVGSTKYNKILSLGNMFTGVWANEPGIDWLSLRQTFPIGTVTATDTFSLDSTMGKVSLVEGDYVKIARTDSKTSEYTIVPISKLYTTDTGNAQGLCARSGSSLVFRYAFTSTDGDFGGTINVPGYVQPETLVSGSDEIQVDDPDWLCFMSAAEYVRNDVTKQNQYPNLVAQANNSMTAMKERNMSQREEMDTEIWRPLGQTW